MVNDSIECHIAFLSSYGLQIIFGCFHFSSSLVTHTYILHLASFSMLLLLHSYLTSHRLCCDINSIIFFPRARSMKANASIEDETRKSQRIHVAICSGLLAGDGTDVPQQSIPIPYNMLLFRCSMTFDMLHIPRVYKRYIYTSTCIIIIYFPSCWNGSTVSMRCAWNVVNIVICFVLLSNCLFDSVRLFASMSHVPMCRFVCMSRSISILCGCICAVCFIFC